MAEGPQTQPSTSSSDQSPSEEPSHHTQVPTLGVLKSRNGHNTIPTGVSPGLSPYQQQLQDQEHMNRGPGLYAVQVQHHHPFMQHMAGFPPHTFIPFTYNLPTERSITDSTEGGSDQGQVGEVPQQQAGPERQVVRRFQIAIHIDLMLILKLIAVIFLFNQDGSGQRLVVLLFFSVLIYLYQTGALAPVVRWLVQGMQRAAAPQHPRPAAVIPEGQQVLGGDENQQAGDGNNGPDEGGNNWWGIAKEIKLIVFGFITSLLPGFHNID